jgi:ABC-type iron transport system FetAB ATPase subunit
VKRFSKKSGEEVGESGCEKGVFMKKVKETQKADRLERLCGGSTLSAYSVASLRLKVRAVQFNGSPQ